MMRGASAAAAIAVAALLVCCSADNHQGQGIAGEHNSAERYDPNGHPTRNLDPLGGGHLIREVPDTHPSSDLLLYLLWRRYNRKGSDEISISVTPSSMFGSGRREPAGESAGYYPQHRWNYNEIDRPDLNPFVSKRNFDEIDQTSMPFPYAIKRFYSMYGNNYLDTPIEAWKSGFDKKRLRPDYPMDEIDLSHFPIGSKRSPGNNLYDVNRFLHSSGLNRKKRDSDNPFDEVDATGLPIGSTR